jgi:hypothetical protein
MVFMVPSNRLVSERMIQPIQIPKSRDINTWRVLMAKTIAKRGGRRDQKPKCSMKSLSSSI